VVVHDVQDHAETVAVRGVDEALERRRATVRLVHREEVDTVVAPAVATVERGDGHDLDEVDPETGEVAEPRDRGVERALRGEGADVQLVDHRTEDARPRPGVVVPVVHGRVEEPARTVDAEGLAGAAGVGARGPAVDAEAVEGVRRERPRRSVRGDPPSVAERRVEDHLDPVVGLTGTVRVEGVP
jgi:hypothetical protein